MSAGDPTLRELLIIGGGPAGLAAAVYAARKKMDILLIAKDIGGQAATTWAIENYMGFKFITGPELVEKFREHVEEWKVPIEYALVEKVEKNHDWFEAVLDSGERRKGQAVIYAAGKSARRLGVPGEREFWGRGVSDCATCDAPLFKGMEVVVVGGGNSALTAAAELVAIAKRVSVVSIAGWTGDPVLQDKVKAGANVGVYKGHEVVEIRGDKLVESVRIRSKKTGEEHVVPARGVFVEIGLVPNSAPVSELVGLNSVGEVIVGCATETNVPGFFAAGDVSTVPEKQIIVAAGEGAKAALSAYSYLLRLGVPGKTAIGAYGD